MGNVFKVELSRSLFSGSWKFWSVKFERSKPGSGFFFN